MLDSATSMAELLRTLVSMPTMPLTVAMGVVLLYWLLVIVGGVGFDGAGDGVAGGAKAAGDAVAGALKGSAEAAGSALKAAGDGVEAKGGLFAVLGLGQVPVTVSVSALVFVAWALTFIGTTVLAPAGLLGQVGLLAGASVASVLVSSLAIKPFAGLFKPPEGQHHAELVGRLCVITSQRVDAGFGTAEVLDGGAAVLVHVACARPNQLKKGDKALLVEAIEGTERFEVEPLDFLEPGELEALADPDRRAQVLAGRVRLK